VSALWRFIAAAQAFLHVWICEKKQELKTCLRDLGMAQCRTVTG
jgi:hypothetical protein